MTEPWQKGGGGSDPSSRPPLPIKQAMSREHRPLCKVGWVFLGVVAASGPSTAVACFSQRGAPGSGGRGGRE